MPSRGGESLTSTVKFAPPAGNPGGWLDGIGQQLDALTDAVLGETAASQIGDGCAEAYAGATLAALLVSRWGREYDIDFTKTDYLGKSSLYLNVFPWTADQEPWRHSDRQAYLEHCQASRAPPSSYSGGD